MKKGILIIIVFLGISRAYCQTKPMFSQYMFNMLTLNPAYAGNRNSTNYTGIFRKQWVGIPGSPTTGMFSADKRLKESNWGIGGQLYLDQLGIEKSTGLHAYATYHLPLTYGGESVYGEETDAVTLSVGLGFGIMNYQADYRLVQTVTPGDPAFNTVINGWQPNAGVGILLHSSKWYIGLSAPALLKSQILNNNQTDVSSLMSNNELFFTGGYIFGKQEDIVKWKPSVLVKIAPGAPIQYDFNLNAWFNNVFAVGASYRTGDAIVGMMELQLTPQMRMGYAYDYTVSQLSVYSRGTHELMLRYEIGSGDKGVAAPVRYY